MSDLDSEHLISHILAMKGKVAYGISEETGVGAFASDDIEEEETVCAVPVRLCISYSVAYNWLKNYLWFTPDTNIHKGTCSTSCNAVREAHHLFAAMCIYLLLTNERFNNPDSFWKPYIGALTTAIRSL